MSFNKNNQRNTKEAAKTETIDPDKGNLKNYVTDETMIKILNKKGITKLFPIQFETFHLIQKGEDIVAKDRTGSGKTLAFSLPIIMKMRKEEKFRVSHKPRFLIILPTRELAIQVREEITSLRIRDKEDFVVTAVYGGSSIEEQLTALSKGADIVVGTPGRLIDFLNRGVLDFAELETICLDEADEMLKIGFKDDIEQIFEFITKKKKSKIQCLLFSATIPEWIWEMSEKYQSKNKKFIDMMKDSNNRTSKTVEHYGLKANPTEKEAYIGSIIKHFFKGKNGKAIIFCETKREVDRIGKSGLIPLSVAILHGDIKQFNREKVFKQFKSGQVDCMIATNVAARGLDFPEIDLIIQMQPPPTTDTYIHRSGRTGRAGKSGVCVTMYSFKEENNMKRIEDEAMIILHQVNSRDLTKSSVGYQAQDNPREKKEKNEYNRDRSYGKERDMNEGRNGGFNGSENKMKQQMKPRDDKKTSDEDVDY